eukprot:gnl/TRDRNA2_/TRDRNA2_174585_c4_seq17.p1 gnl/TRDRNA2_/TRDRNA2_174585_c4~~gnl/TRDRNA2_/TRDRNA2_174585_c4_seq17.p1  ORF type:complete len:369 (+),score=93.68 gnl/TRDRNA2_/TRDRNA2_174585_c4_seq17:142-1248(+)
MSLLVILAVEAAATASHVSAKGFSLSFSLLGIAQFIIAASEIEDGQCKRSDVISLLRTDMQALAERSSTSALSADCESPTPDTRCEQCQDQQQCQSKWDQKLQEAAEVLQPLRDALWSLFEAAQRQRAGQPPLNPQKVSEAVEEVRPFRDALKLVVDSINREGAGGTPVSYHEVVSAGYVLQPVRAALLWLVAFASRYQDEQGRSSYKPPSYQSSAYPEPSEEVNALREYPAKIGAEAADAAFRLAAAAAKADRGPEYEAAAKKAAWEREAEETAAADKAGAKGEAARKAAAEKAVAAKREAKRIRANEEAADENWSAAEREAAEIEAAQKAPAESAAAAKRVAAQEAREAAEREAARAREAAETEAA